jgi:mono/diheme cytochrome c family protein
MWPYETRSTPLSRFNEALIVMAGSRPNLHRDPPSVFRAGIVATALVTAVAVVWALAAASARPAAPQSAAHVSGIVDRVRALEPAAVRGDLGAAREAATWLAEHAAPSPLPAGTRPLVGRLKEASSAVTRAADVADTVTATADLVASCGSCHEAAKVTPVFPRAAPPAFESIAGHMVRHQDAADLMLEGLIVPSATAWTRGAGQLREAPVKPGDFPVSDRIGALMSEVEKRLHAQADDAAKASDAPSRTRAYGGILTTCAECHTRHTTLWGPARR